MKIGIIDSGIGGLSVLKEIDDKFKGNTLYYYADSDGFPYGNKEKAYLQDRLFSIAKDMIYKYKIEILILACNTASTNALIYLKCKLTIPVLGVEPYVPKDYRGRIVVIATKATINAIQTNYVNKNLIFLEEPFLATEIENNFDKRAIIAKKLVKKIKKFQPEILILGCTHYVLLARFIKYFYKNIIIMSSINILIDNMENYIKSCQNKQKNLIEFVSPINSKTKFEYIFNNI